MPCATSRTKLPCSDSPGEGVDGITGAIPSSALRLAALPLEVLRSVRGRFNLCRALDREISNEVTDFLSKPSTLEAVLKEVSGAAPQSIRELAFLPGKIIGCGHTRTGVNLRVTMRGDRGEYVVSTFVLKMEREPYREWRIIDATGAPQQGDIELRVNEFLQGATHRNHFVRTIASCIGPRGNRIALETCAHGEPLIDVLRTRYPVGLAASVQAMTVMSDTWRACKDDKGRGILFDSHTDDIIVAGSTPENVHACFVDCHEGRYIGDARLLLRAVARLMVDTFYYTPIGWERELLQRFSPELITAKVLDPLRSVVSHAPPEDLLARDYYMALDQLNLDEIGNPWQAAGLGSVRQS